MQRIIKFRGLTANGDMVYGYLVPDLPDSTVYYKEYSQRICWYEGQAHHNIPVKNGTVGEYTGLKDSNAREIYEGDILLAEDEYTDRILDDGTGPREPLNHLAPVEFHDGSFGITISNRGDNYSEGFWPFDRILNDIGDTPSEMEVIGNIYENKELLDD